MAEGTFEPHLGDGGMKSMVSHSGSEQDFSGSSPLRGDATDSMVADCHCFRTNPEFCVDLPGWISKPIEAHTVDGLLELPSWA